ncbi:MAG: DUF1697 domain-containing protein [Polyangia bacterium]
MRYVGLVRALNVGGTGKLSMKALVACCTQLGYSDVETYIQSGNVVFGTRAAEKKVKADLQCVLTEKMGAAIDVLVRTHAELAALEQKNPYPDAEPSRVLVYFLDVAPKKDELDVTGPDGETVHGTGRDVFVHYPAGQGRSKLKLAFGRRGTARNLNTVRKLIALTK